MRLKKIEWKESLLKSLIYRLLTLLIGTLTAFLITGSIAIATGTAIATANYLGQKGGLFKALTAASIGMMGIYALEVIEEKLDQKYLTNENCKIEEDIYE